MQINEIERCVHGQESPCGCACPFGLNTREFMEKLQRGSFGAAFNQYRNAVVFPEIVQQICPAPCKAACSHALGTQAINLPLLELAAIEFARSTDPIRFNLPQKEGSIAVIGSGLAGLACALKLSSMRYRVTVFEQEKQICPSLEKILDRDFFEPQLYKQFKFVECDFRFEQKIERLEQVGDFDAVYLCAGVRLDGEEKKVFRCPENASAVEQIIAGDRIADDIEWFIKTGNRKPAAPVQTVVEKTAVSYHEGEGNAIVPENGVSYSKAEARQEAARCTMCDCSACMKECVLMRQYGATPRDLAKDVGLSLNLFPETQGRAAMREIGSCNFCGLCGKICPEGIDIGAFLLHSRTELCQKGLLPPAHHDFWLRDMAFADSEQAAILHLPQQECKYLYFPGCQAGGSDPRYVTMTYDRLVNQEPETGLYLRCCGAPALWAGEADMFNAEHREIRDTWEQAGKPVVLMGCPSCYRIFREYLPDIPVQMIYEVLHCADSEELPFDKAAVFDPCSSRDFPQMQQAVRRLSSEAGIVLEELRSSPELAQCCSWGGQGYAVNPLFVKTQAKEQAELSDLPYITYCTNCRDIFSARGKSCRHILDIMHGINPQDRRPPTASERRNNRRALKRELAERFGLKIMEQEREMVKLSMQPAIAEKLSADLILDEDVSAVISECEETGRYLKDLDTGHRIGHLKRGYITYWIEYAPKTDAVFEIYNAYSHRMAIKSEYGE